MKNNNTKKYVKSFEELIDYRIDTKLNKIVNQKEVVIKKVYNSSNYTARRADVAFVEDSAGGAALKDVPINIPYPVNVGDRAYLFYLGRNMQNAWIGHLITYSSVATQNSIIQSFVSNLPTVNISIHGEEVKFTLPNSVALNSLVKENKAQIWLYFERNMNRKVSNFAQRKENPDLTKKTLTYKKTKEWVHFEDKTPTAPTKLFFPKRRYIKGQGGLGYRAYREKIGVATSVPSYMNHNGYIPTEFILNKIDDNSNVRYRICKGKHDDKWVVTLNPIEDILKQLLVRKDKTPLPENSTITTRVKVLGLHTLQKRTTDHRIKVRAKLVVNINGVRYESEFGNMLTISAPSNYVSHFFAWRRSTGRFGYSIAEK